MGGSKKATPKSPPINTTDKEEEKFIQYVLNHKGHAVLRDLGWLC